MKVQQRALIAMVVVAALLSVSAVFLPWSTPDSSYSASRRGFEGRLGDLVASGGMAAAAFVAVPFVVMALTVILVVRGRRKVAVGTGVLGLALMAGLLLVTQQGATCWDGVDSQGRPTGDCFGYVPGSGAWAALLAALIVMALPWVAPRRVPRRTRTPRSVPGRAD